jgi:hypothetical protein
MGPVRAKLSHRHQLLAVSGVSGRVEQLAGELTITARRHTEPAAYLRV